MQNQSRYNIIHVAFQLHYITSSYSFFLHNCDIRASVNVLQKKKIDKNIHTAQVQKRNRAPNFMLILLCFFVSFFCVVLLSYSLFTCGKLVLCWTCFLWDSCFNCFRRNESKSHTQKMPNSVLTFFFI